MCTDTYTKAVLTVIAVLLAVIAGKQYFTPETIANAQGPFAGVQYTSNAYLSFFDPRTGEIWNYGGDGQPSRNYPPFKLTKQGQPLAKVK
jgi:hypothetical protein